MRRSRAYLFNQARARIKQLSRGSQGSLRNSSSAFLLFLGLRTKAEGWNWGEIKLVWNLTDNKALLVFGRKVYNVCSECSACFSVSVYLSVCACLSMCLLVCVCLLSVSFPVSLSLSYCLPVFFFFYSCIDLERCELFLSCSLRSRHSTVVH